MPASFYTPYTATIVAALALAACQSVEGDLRYDSSGQQRAVQTTPVPTVRISVPPNTKLASVAYTKSTINVRAGTQIGTQAENSFDSCTSKSKGIVWKAGLDVGKGDQRAAVFHDTLVGAGYTVAGIRGDIFAGLSAERKKPDYFIGAQIEKINIRQCDTYNRLLDISFLRRDQTTTINVRWLALSRLSGKIAFETTTQGTIKTFQKRPGPRIAMVPEPFSVTFHRAFAQAAANLADDPAFFKFLSQPGPDPRNIKAVDNPALRLKPVQLSRTPIQQNIQSIRQSVVTIGTGGGGIGSGFFIAPNLIMTNNHVVEGSSILKVTLVNGRNILGEVIRAHPQRDVAILQVEEQGSRSLAIRIKPLEVTEEVFAIGTPLERRLKGTVTKGIVSAFRQNDFGLEDIQADVDIHGGNSGGALLDINGNVVGISYSGLSAGTSKFSSGLNFFVPINDALEKLNIRLDPNAEASSGSGS